MNSKLRVREALDVLYMQGEASGAFNGTAIHHVAAVTEAEKAIRQAVGEEMLAIIGEDEPEEGLTSYYPGIERDSMHREGRNMLRAELRQKIKQWAALKETSNE